MSLIQTCKCEECDMQKSFANHWVMLYERNGTLVILPKWDEKMVRRTRHFCGRAHASRYVERWIATPVMGAIFGAAAEPARCRGRGDGGGTGCEVWLRRLPFLRWPVLCLMPAAFLPIGVSMEGRTHDPL
jgi:hypothetical protein